MLPGSNQVQLLGPCIAHSSIQPVPADARDLRCCTAAGCTACQLGTLQLLPRPHPAHVCIAQLLAECLHCIPHGHAAAILGPRYHSACSCKSLRLSPLRSSSREDRASCRLAAAASRDYALPVPSCSSWRAKAFDSSHAHGQHKHNDMLLILAVCFSPLTETLHAG